MKRDIDIAWAAGLFEGEGCITVRMVGHKYPSWGITLVMTDEDVVRKFTEIIGCGNLRLEPSRNPKRKPIWCWNTYNRIDVFNTLEMLLPYLGARRRSRAEECLGAITPLLGKRRGGWVNRTGWREPIQLELSGILQ